MQGPGDASAVRWLGSKPELHEPTLVVMLSGWIDAGGAARGAVGAIEEESGLTPVAEFDDDLFVDFRARRPTMELRDGLHNVLHWERILLSTGTDQTGRDLLVLNGPEPDMAWHRFTRTVVDVALELGVTQMAHLGAYPFAAPHTRPSRVSVTTPSQDVLARVPFLRSTIDVPAGVAAALETEFHARGVPALGVWAQVPHYIASMNYPAASVALIDALREATGLVIDAPDLRAEVHRVVARLNSMIEGNDEHVAMLRQLEHVYDASADSVDVPTAGPSLELRSGDELAAELEQFLKDQP